MTKEPSLWGIYRLTQEHGLNGPFGILPDRALSERYARELFGKEGVVQETNPDHMCRWGYGRGARQFDGTPYAPFARVLVGETNPIEVDLLHGEHPHTRRDESVYARFPDGQIEGFDGHRFLCEIHLRDFNYLKTSDLSGNEVRRGGSCKILINNLVVFTFFYREIEEALIRARDVVFRLQEHPARPWTVDKVVGRKVYWRETPATIEKFDEGRLFIRNESGLPFPANPWEKEEILGGDAIDLSETIITDFLDPHIWWFRGEEP